MNGTEGEAKRLEAIKIQLTGADKEKYDVYYRVHAQSYGWLAWATNGAPAGTAGYAKRLEGINIKLTNKPYSGSIVYTTHVQSIGWQGNENNVNTWFRDGQMAGTSGRAKRLEAIRIALTGEMAEHYDVYYRVHAQTYGWLAWAKNGEAAGTAGLSKRLEGIQIVLVPKGGAAPANNYGDVVTTNKQTYIKK